MNYCSLFSSSSGNSTYFGTEKGGILIDAGVSAKRLEEALRCRGLDVSSVRAVFVSHEHSDHIAGIKVLCRRYHWPILASAGTLDALAESDKIDADFRLYALNPGQGVEVAGMDIVPFSVPHDSRDCLGFRVNGRDGVCAAVATDMGVVLPAVVQAITGCRLVHIESNHDPEMLRNGPYPYVLQQRILGRGGHLSNEACAGLLPGLVQTGTTRFVLGHLSQHNNTPVLARDTALACLSSASMQEGKDFTLDVASPEGLPQGWEV